MFVCWSVDCLAGCSAIIFLKGGKLHFHAPNRELVSFRSVEHEVKQTTELLLENMFTIKKKKLFQYHMLAQFMNVGFYILQV